MTDTATDAPAPKKGAPKPADTATPAAYTQAEIDAAVAAALASKRAGTASGYSDPTVPKGTREQNGFKVTDR
jgi:hypothetical protein